MKLVIDTNILFSALLYKRRIHDLLFYNEDLQLYAPDLLYEEMLRHKEKIRRLTRLSSRETDILFNKILPRRVTIVPHEEYMNELKKAVQLLQQVDLSDTPFVALAMRLGVPLWTGDKRIIELSVRTGFEYFVAVDTGGVEMLLEGKSLGEVEERMRVKYG